MKTDDGGPAFPAPSVYLDESVSPRQVEQGELGMTLRDWFAGQALAGANMSKELGNPDISALQLTEFCTKMTHDAYVMADAMLVARKESS